MKIMMLMNLLISNSIIFLFLTNPINMGMMIMIQTINSCILMNILLNYSWLSYITFIVMIGGLMIIFIYMCMLSWNLKMFIKMTSMILIITFMIINFNFIILIKFINLNKIFIINFKIMNKLILNNYKINMIKFFMKNSLMMILMMINMLLMTLIIINKMNKKMNNPLRKMFY